MDLKHQPDPITPKKNQLFQEFVDDPEIAKFYLLLIRRREIEMKGDGIKLIDVKVK